MSSEKNIGDQVASGTVWTVSMRLVVRLFGLLNVAVLARLLTKEDFGIVALLISTSAVLTMLLEVVMRVALLRITNIRDEHYGAVFVVRLIGGAIVGLVLVLIAGSVATFFETPQLETALYVFSAIIFIEGFTSPWVVSFQRNLEFSRDFTFEVIVGLGRIFASIGFALWFRNFWGIIAGLGVAAVLRIIVSYAMCFASPIRVDRQAFVDVWNVSKWAMTEGFASFVEERADRLMIGKVGAIGQLGVFSTVIDLVTLPIGSLILPIGRAILPGLHKLKAEAPEKIGAAYGTAVSSMAAVSLPIGFGILMVADPLIRTVLGDKWESAIVLVQFLAPFVIAEGVMASYKQVLFAEGNLRAVTFVQWGKTFCYLPAIYWGFQVYGLEGAALAKSTVSVLAVLPSFLILNRTSGIIWGKDTWQILRSFFAAIAMFFVWIALEPIIVNFTVNSIQQLLLFSALGAGTYGLSLFLIWRVSGRPEGIEGRVETILMRRFQQ